MSLLTVGGTSKVLFPGRGRSWAVPPLPHGGIQPVLSPKSQLRAEPDPLQARLFAVPDANS